MNKKINILVTGGYGFIGSNFIRYMLKHYLNVYITNVDNMTYAGNYTNLHDVWEGYRDRYNHYNTNISHDERINRVFQENSFDYVVNFAAETHVDRSIYTPQIFVTTNVLGTSNLLECAKNHKVKRFLQISTDEVYGSLGDIGAFTETSPLQPSSPYSASKTSADLIALSYHKTYDMDVVVTRCSNNYGAYQYPEKLIPLMILLAKNDKSLPIYGTGNNVRDWIHVDDHCSAVAAVLFDGEAGEVYNIGSNNEKPNIEIVETILNHLGKPMSLITFVEDRKGHDWRYAIDSSKIRDTIGWKPSHTFESGIKNTIDWYLNNEHWWKPLIKF